MGAFRKGALIGFAFGYVKGSKAGRERYEQINRTWSRVKATPTYQQFTAVAGSVVGQGIQKSKVVALDAVGKASEKIRHPLGQNGSSGM